MATQLHIDDLVKTIKTANEAYYNGTPNISDEEYDAIKDELKELDGDNPVLADVGAPVDDNSHWEKERHQIPMSSLDKVNTVPEVHKWSDKYKIDEICVQEKLDGISLSLNYESGKLISAVTRGDGLVGENITRNVKKMKGVPEVLGTPLDVSIRGEVILYKEDWTKHFADMSNPRNAASGMARRITGGGQEHLHVICYDIIGVEINFEHEVFKILKDLGFNTPYHTVISPKEIDTVYDDYQNVKRNLLPYEIDGLVLKANNKKAQQSLGRHGDRDNANPRGQVALKFAHEMRKSILRDVKWEVGLTGRVTPVAHFDSVSIAGVNVAKASLHNLRNIKELGVKINSEILVSRRNDVIPFVEKVLKQGDVDILIPDNCPSCGTNVEQKGEFIQCPNEECRAAGNIEKWVKKFEIDSVGPKLIANFVESELVFSPADLYRLTTDELMKLERMGEKLAQKIVDNIQAKKQAPLNVFLGALNIQSCGSRVFEAICNSGFDTLEQIQELKESDIARLEGFGDIMAKQVVAGLRRKKDLIDDLLNVGVKIVKVSKGEKLKNQSFCFSGKSNLSRKELETLVKTNGGEVKSVSKELKYLVLADPDSASSKATKAKSMGVQIISEDDFINMLK